MNFQSNNIKKLIEEIDQNPYFVFIKELTKEFPRANVYLVGGAVRDALLGKENKDYDFLVTDVDKEKLENFLKKFGKVSQVDSRAFGVFKFRPEGWQGEEEIDIALPRKEKQTGLGYKDFKIETSPELSINDDLSRRDFTMNAIAINFKTGELIDPFDGQKDLKRRIIRAVGNPEERFMEDPSRILRAIRLACQFNFDIEINTYKASKKLVPEINKNFVDNSGKEKQRVSSEVFASEFLKGLDKNPVRLIKLYDKMGILKLILPEIFNLKGVEQPREFHSEGDVWEHTILALKNLNQNSNINVKLAILFHDIGKPKTQTMPRDKNDRIRFNDHDNYGAEIFIEICDKLKFSSPFSKNHPLYVDKKEIVWLIKNHMICVNKNPKEMRLGTIEKYFFKNKAWGKHLLEIAKADISATILATGKPDFSNFNILKERIKEVEKILEVQEKEEKLAKKFPPILDGYEIQKIFSIKASPLVGRIKDLVRYLQLDGRIKTKEDVISIKDEIIKVCQKTKTTEEAEKYFFKSFK